MCKFYKNLDAVSKLYTQERWQKSSIKSYKYQVDRDHSVGIATRYGVDRSGIQFRWGGGGGSPAPGWVPSFFPGDKEAGA
jgi:hypothetical protein